MAVRINWPWKADVPLNHRRYIRGVLLLLLAVEQYSGPTWLLMGMQDGTTFYLWLIRHVYGSLMLQLFVSFQNLTNEGVMPIRGLCFDTEPQWFVTSAADVYVLTQTSTGWANWILLRKFKYFKCCLRDVFLFLPAGAGLGNVSSSQQLAHINILPTFCPLPICFRVVSGLKRAHINFISTTCPHLILPTLYPLTGRWFLCG